MFEKYIAKTRRRELGEAGSWRAGDPSQFQNRVLSGPGQAAAANPYASASFPQQQQQQPSYVQQAYPAANPPAYAPQAYTSDPRTAATVRYAPSYPPVPQPQPPQPPMDPRAKIEAIRAAIAAQTAPAPTAAAAQPGSGHLPAVAPSILEAQPQPQPLLAAASPAAPLPVATFDLFSILQNAGVKPAVSSAPQGGSVGPQDSDKQPISQLELKASVEQSLAPAPDGAVASSSAAAEGKQEAKEEVKAEEADAAPVTGPVASAPNITAEMMQLLGKLETGAGRLDATPEGSTEIEPAPEPNLQQEMMQLLHKCGGA